MVKWEISCCCDSFNMFATLTSAVPPVDEELGFGGMLNLVSNHLPYFLPAIVSTYNFLHKLLCVDRLQFDPVTDYASLHITTFPLKNLCQEMLMIPCPLCIKQSCRFLRCMHLISKFRTAFVD